MKKGEKKREKRKKIWEIIRKVLGIILIVIGIFGLFLPFLQGFLLIIIGIALYENKSVKRAISDFIEKFKKKKKSGKAKGLKGKK